MTDQSTDCPMCGDDVEDGCPCSVCNVVFCIDCANWDEDYGDWVCLDCKGTGHD